LFYYLKTPAILFVMLIPDFARAAVFELNVASFDLLQQYS